MAANTYRRKSPIWDYLQLAEDSKYALCNYCGKLISRGGDSTRVYSTTNLVNHLKSTHKEAYQEYKKKHTKYREKEKEKQEIQPSGSKQLSTR